MAKREKKAPKNLLNWEVTSKNIQDKMEEMLAVVQAVQSVNDLNFISDRFAQLALIAQMKICATLKNDGFHECEYCVDFNK